MKGAPSRAAVRAWARLVRASQSIINGVEADVREAGFPPLDWYDCLLELERAGHGGLRPAELREKLNLAQYNLSRMISRMAKQGMVDKAPCSDDGRGQVLTINETGRTVLRRMWPAYSASIQSRIGIKLPDDELHMLCLLLGKLAP